MSDPVATRQDTVEANLQAVITKYGDEAYNRIISQCLQDINISLALLVDAGSSETTT